MSNRHRVFQLNTTPVQMVVVFSSWDWVFSLAAEITGFSRLVALLILFGHPGT